MTSFIAPWLIEIWEYLRLGNTKTYYSQFGEDIFLRSFFRGKKTYGFYVDVGANHPFRCSNTYLLYKNGWRGIAIEPDRVSSTLFRWFRKRDIVVRCGVGRPGVRSFYRSADPRQGTFSRDVAEDSNGRGIATISQENIQMRELKDILEEHAVRDVDVLTIDTEGGDLEVLQTLDWERVRPTVILVEEHGFDSKDASRFPIYAFVVSHGYRLACHLGYTLIFVKENLEGATSPAAAH